jgi:hypothetical protein
MGATAMDWPLSQHGALCFIISYKYLPAITDRTFLSTGYLWNALVPDLLQLSTHLPPSYLAPFQLSSLHIPPDGQYSPTSQPHGRHPLVHGVPLSSMNRGEGGRSCDTVELRTLGTISSGPAGGATALQQRCLDFVSC